MRNDSGTAPWASASAIRFAVAAAAVGALQLDLEGCFSLSKREHLREEGNLFAPTCIERSDQIEGLLFYQTALVR